MSNIPDAPDIDSIDTSNPKLLEVFPHDVVSALLQCKMDSAPGVSKIS